MELAVSEQGLRGYHVRSQAYCLTANRVVAPTINVLRHSKPRGMIVACYPEYI